MPIYLDETGREVSTHSMLKTFRRCPKQTEYKYIMRLKPKVLGQPLRRGTWIHSMLEMHSKALRDGHSEQEAQEAAWEIHQQLCYRYSDLFDEEKDDLGDLPNDIRDLMRGYFWHYKNHQWKVLDVEFVLECELPDGSIFRCKIDVLVEDQYGLWIVDHKSHKTLPSLDYRILDAQSGDYIWCALKNKLPVQGHIWNYIKWKAPTKPKMVYGGSRLSKSAIETEYLTFVRTLKQLGVDIAHHPDPRIRQEARRLKAMQYQHGEMQLSPFYRRDVLEKNPQMLRRIAQEAFHTSKRMRAYPWDRKDAVERVVDRSCTFMCSYTDICTLELFGGNVNNLLKQKYTVGDPLEYYNDDRMEKEERG